VRSLTCAVIQTVTRGSRSQATWRHTRRPTSSATSFSRFRSRKNVRCRFT